MWVSESSSSQEVREPVTVEGRCRDHSEAQRDIGPYSEEYERDGGRRVWKRCGRRFLNQGVTRGLPTDGGVAGRDRGVTGAYFVAGDLPRTPSDLRAEESTSWSVRTRRL